MEDAKALYGDRSPQPRTPTSRTRGSNIAASSTGVSGRRPWTTTVASPAAAVWFAIGTTTLTIPLASASQRCTTAKSPCIVVRRSSPMGHRYWLRPAARAAETGGWLAGGGCGLVRGVGQLLREVVADESEEVLARRRRRSVVAERVGEQRAGPGVRARPRSPSLPGRQLLLPT